MINLELFFGGDYKFLLTVMGLQNATSNHSCIWCKVHRESRWDMSYNLSHYNEAPLKRTLKEIMTMAGKGKNNYCCVNQPLIEIDLDHIIVDELHLLLRVVDVLIDNLIEDVLEWDKREDLRKKRNEERGIHLNQLIETVRSCGVSFNIWQKNNDGKSSGKYECTSLLGNDKKILLRLLPDKLRMAIQEETSDIVKKIWLDFHEIYQTISKDNPTEHDIENSHRQAKAWINLFLSLNGKRKGYNKTRVTPYMHILVYHVPVFLKQYSTLKVFTGLGVEKKE